MRRIKESDGFESLVFVNLFGYCKHPILQKGIIDVFTGFPAYGLPALSSEFLLLHD